jgi:hypothetical protein
MIFDVINQGPLSKGFRFTIPGDIECIPLIVSLFFITCPFAVLRVVSGVVVNSLNCFGFSGMTHICNKVRDRMPSLTHSNASATVIWKRMIVLLVAPRHHAKPNSVCSSSAKVVSLLVWFWTCAKFFEQTTARLGVAILELATLYNSSVTALANALPFIPTPNCRVMAQHS